MRLAVDATYSVGSRLSGVGVYSNEIIGGVASRFPHDPVVCAFRPHRFLRGLAKRLPPNCRRRILWEARADGSITVFHGLNQRLPAARYRRAACTFHDLFVLTGEYSTPEYRERFARQAREAAERADLIVAVSRFTASQVRDLLGVEESRIRVVPHGVHLPAPAARRPREPFILHVGAIQRRKNIARLLRAFERVPAGWRLVMAGAGGFESEEILSLVARSPRRGDVELLGYVPRAALEDLYSRAGVFAFPSLDEGFGIPVLEAMAWGAPVVTSNRSALPEVAGDAALLVDPFREEEIAAALIRVIEDSRLAELLRNRGRERAAQFPWRRAVDGTCCVYRELD